MPIYTFECPKCGATEEQWRKLEQFGERKLCVKCPCFVEMNFIIPRFNINPDYKPWLDENLCGQDGVPVLVKGRRHQKQLLKERGLEIK